MPTIGFFRPALILSLLPAMLFQWFWNYVTRNRSARLITGTQPELVAGSDFSKGVNEVRPQPAGSAGA